MLIDLNDYESVLLKDATEAELVEAKVYLKTKVDIIRLQLEVDGKENIKWYSDAQYARIKTSEQLMFVDNRLKEIHRAHNEECSKRKKVKDYLIAHLKSIITEEEFNNLLEEANK